jgi:hypothetical protein
MFDGARGSGERGEVLFVFVLSLSYSVLRALPFEDVLPCIWGVSRAEVVEREVVHEGGRGRNESKVGGKRVMCFFGGGVRLIVEGRRQVIVSSVSLDVGDSGKGGGAGDGVSEPVVHGLALFGGSAWIRGYVSG